MGKHVIILYISIKLIVRHMKESTWHAPKDMGGAPPHKNNLIGTVAYGRVQIKPLKMNDKSF